MKKIKNSWNAFCNYLKENAKDPSLIRYEANNSSSHGAGLTCSVMSVLVFVVYYKIAYAFCTVESLQDMKAHAIFAQNFYLDPEAFLKAWLRVPHMLWHLVTKTFESRLGMPLWDAASLSFALFGLFAFGVMTWFLYGFLKCHTGQKRLALASLGGAALSFVGPLIMQWFSDPYAGSFSPNPLHNPTHVASKGFGMIAMMAGIDVIRRYRNERPAFFQGKHVYLWFAIASFFSALAKPTFIYMLLPAGVLVILVDLIAAINQQLLGQDHKERSGKKKSGKQGNASQVKAIWGAAWRLAIATLPTCAYLIAEYVAVFNYGRDKGSSAIITEPFYVWHFFTWDVPTSVLLGMFFPLWMLVTNLGYFYKSAEGRLSVLGYAFGVLEFSFLAESGTRMDAANFSWCMMAGMTVFYAVAVYRLMLTSLQEKQGKRHTAYLIISWFLLFLHVYSGLSIYNVFNEIL